MSALDDERERLRLQLLAETGPGLHPVVAARDWRCHTCSGSIRCGDLCVQVWQYTRRRFHVECGEAWRDAVADLVPRDGDVPAVDLDALLAAS